MSQQPPWDPEQQDPDPYQGQPPYSGQPYGPPGGQPTDPGQPYGPPGGEPTYPGQPYGPPSGQPTYPGQPYGPPSGQPTYPGQPYGPPGGPAPNPGFGYGYGPQPPPHKKPRRKRHLARNILAGIGALIVVIIAVSIASSHGSGVSPAASSGISSSQAAAAPTSAAGLPSGGQQYASDMQNTFSFGGSVTDSAIATFGQNVCLALKSGTSVASEATVAQQSWSNTSPGDAIQMITLAEKDMCPSQQTAQTVTYIVTGTSGADVTYGPAGSDLSGSVPMRVSQPLGNPSYYAINAQLQGDGEVTCKIRVDGVTISSATASGGYNIADCEIGQNPTTQSWENDNTG